MNQLRKDEVQSTSQPKDKVYKDDSFCSRDLYLKDFMGEKESQDYQYYPGAESEDYDFTAERHNAPHTTNLVESTAHLIKGCLGAGVLSMHVGFMYAGIWTAVIASIIIGLIISYSMATLVKSAHIMYVRLRIPKLSYPDLVEVAVATGPCSQIKKFSKAFRYTVDTFLFIEMCGSCCIYEIMIAKIMKQVLESVSPVIQESDMDIRYYILIIAVPLIILCMIRSLKYLAPFSVIADIVVGVCVLVTVYYSLNSLGKISDRPIWKNFDGLIKFSGVFMYSIDGIAVIMPVENNMKTPKYFFLVLQYGMTTTILMVTCIGFFGYWGWGENCKSPITVHMPDEILPLILQVLLAIMLSVTFAVHLWVPFRGVWYYIGRMYKSKHARWERFYRLVHVLLITGLTVAFPNFIQLMIFVGNFFLAFIIFIFPAMIESLVRWREPRKGVIRWNIIKNGLITVVGIIFSCGAFYSSIEFT